MTGASETLTNREKLIYRTTGILCAVMVSASSTLSLTIISLFLTDRKERSSTWDYRTISR
jgi:hypothetical protein